MTNDHDDHENPLEESVLDMGEMRVLSVLPNDADKPTFAFISLIEPDEDLETTDPSVLIAEIKWAELLQLAIRDNSVFDFNDVPEHSIIPMLWHPGPAMDSGSGLTYQEHFDAMVERVCALAFFGDWDFVRIALQWERYRGPMSVVLHPEMFRRTLMRMFQNEEVREHVQDMMNRAQEYDDEEGGSDG